MRMKEDKFNFSNILFGFIFSVLVIYMCLVFTPAKREIHSLYQVYLGSDKIGLIKSKDELYELIDKEQQEIKDKYNVTKVYSPSGLEVRPVKTYYNNVMSAKQVYEEIKDLEPFTIEGYEVTITKNEKNESFYILDKDELDTAVRNTVLAFVDEDQYNKYLNGEQDKVKDTGTEITNIYLNNDVVIKKTYVPTDELIITDQDTLNMYFLFGTTNLISKYKVKSTDTIDTIANNNKLGVSEFLIANPDIVGENALLAVGQEVTVAPISPLSDIIVESFDTEYQTIKYETKLVYDKTLNADQSYVKQAGSNGLTKVTFATKEKNGRIINSAQVSNEVIKPAVDRIMVYGAKNVVYYGNTTYWAWPTVKPFRISSYYGWRIHPIEGRSHLHTGVDITGTSSKNIFAIQSGVIKSAAYGWNGGAGNNIRIDHGNGYVSVYMHLSKILVSPGERVEKGQLIGYMGCSGSCTGTHLHLTVYKNGNLMDPLKLYQ